MSDYCRTCQAPIVWCTSVAGQPMALDAKPEQRVVVDSHHVGRVVDTYTQHQHRKPTPAEQDSAKEP